MGDQKALVTGASSGIGRGLSRRLARDGVHVVVSARRAAELEDLAREIEQSGGRATVLPLDVSDTARTAAAIRQIDDELGGLDLVIANAGTGGPQKLADLTWESIAPVLSVNFNGAIATLTAVLPRMLARRRGHLVAVSSLAAITALPTGAAYCGSKAGLSMFMDALRLDLRGTGVNATIVQPGSVRTPLTDKAKRPPPMMMECDAAVDLIVDRLRSAPAFIEFPLPMVATLRTIARMPLPVREAMTRAFPVPDEDQA